MKKILLCLCWITGGIFCSNVEGATRVLFIGFEPVNEKVFSVKTLFSLMMEEFKKRPPVRPIELRYQLLPSFYLESGKKLKKYLAQFHPQVVFLLGETLGNQFRLEKVAFNEDNSSVADGRGVIRTNRVIVSGGASQLISTLPLKKIEESWIEAHIPYRYSSNAGGHLNNHVFYYLQYYAPKDAKTGLILIPRESDMSQRLKAVRMALETTLVKEEED